MFENVFIIALFAVLIIIGIIIAVRVGSKYIVSPEKDPDNLGGHSRASTDSHSLCY